MKVLNGLLFHFNLQSRRGPQGDGPSTPTVHSLGVGAQTDLVEDRRRWGTRPTDLEGGVTGSLRGTNCLISGSVRKNKVRDVNFLSI